MLLFLCNSALIFLLVALFLTDEALNNFSNGMNWISFASIATTTSDVYGVALTLSIGLISFID